MTNIGWRRRGRLNGALTHVTRALCYVYRAAAGFAARVFDILLTSTLCIVPSGSDMKLRLLSVFGLVLLNPGAGFSQLTLNPSPERVVGQPQLPLETSNPNLIEGRELFEPGGIALDTSVTPPILYVSDTCNSRVLAWKNALAFQNGQQADLVIGQPDFFTTFPEGPNNSSSQFSTGLTFPTGIAVRNGNLYVVDSGNNRVLRFPAPFAQTNIFPDLVIGQPDFRSGGANYGTSTGQTSAKGITLVSGNGAFCNTAYAVYPGNIAFDGNGNLYLTDAGNRRVLRFPASALVSGNFGASANLAIGQNDLTSLLPALPASPTNTIPNPGTTCSSLSQTSYCQFATPSAIAFDSSGNLWVSDRGLSYSNPYGNTPGAAYGRVLVFSPPFTTGMSASRIMGAILGIPTQSQSDASLMFDPAGIFFFPDGSVGVADTAASRILEFPPLSQWPAQGTTFSPQADAVIGQAFDFTNFNPNNGQPAPSASAFALPAAAIFSGTELYVADSGNNRVIVMPFQPAVQASQPSGFGPATRVLGQDDFIYGSPNLIEGREFNFSVVFTTATGLQIETGAGVVVDTTSNPPHLYVADPGNHRILGFKDVRMVKPGIMADLVIGQPDFKTGVCNYPTNNTNQPNRSSLCFPAGLALDSSGNLYVADSGNGRVLRFPAPFAFQGRLEPADLVLGQANFTFTITDPTNVTMARPYGLAFAGNNGLLVTDLQDNRMLFFPMTNGAFTSGEAATKVFGQPDFKTILPGTGLSGMNSPHHVSCDTDSRAYVADTNNSRVLIFDQIANTPNTGAVAVFAVAQDAVRGLYVSPLTGQVWVAGAGNNVLVEYPRYDKLILGNPTAATIPSPGPVALTEDRYGDLVVADSTHRVALYYPGLQAMNGANFLPAWPIAPGMVAAVCAQGSNCNNPAPQFGSATARYTDLANPVPLPSALGDIQVLFNGSPTPLLFVSPGQINFYVPMSAPTTGTADVQVVSQSTGQIYGAGPVQMNSVSPGIFQASHTGPARQATVLNQDGTSNGPNNCAKRGSVIQIFATGQGYVAGAPPDGAVVSSLAPTSPEPIVVINQCRLNDTSCTNEPDLVKVSTLAPGQDWVWEVDAQIPMVTPPGPQIPIGIVLNSLPSDDPGEYLTVICVSQ